MLVGSVPMHRHAWIIAAVFNLKYQLLSAVQLYLADSEIGSLSKAALFFSFMAWAFTVRSKTSYP